MSSQIGLGQPFQPAYKFCKDPCILAQNLFWPWQTDPWVFCSKSKNQSEVRCFLVINNNIGPVQPKLGTWTCNWTFTLFSNFRLLDFQVQFMYYISRPEPWAQLGSGLDICPEPHYSAGFTVVVLHDFTIWSLCIHMWCEEYRSRSHSRCF